MALYVAGRPADLKARVVWATVLLVVAKLTLVVVPYFFKWATDALAGDFKTPPPLPAFMLAPVMLVIAYNVIRIVQGGFNQLRDALFARVGQHAVRKLAFRTFVHLHELSLRFHLERRTGGLSRVIERGTKGIETIVRFTMLNTAPTIVEFVLTAAHLRLRLRLALCRGDRRHRLALHLVHRQGEQLAHLDPPRDERHRHRRQHQGDRLAAQLRDGQIFRQREDGGRALRPLDGALRGCRDQDLDLARLAEFRPGRDLRRSA